MTRGRKKQPAAALKRTGSRRAKGRAATELPTFPPVQVAQPGWMPEKAKTVWRQLVPMLQGRRLLGEEDLRTLERYCVTYCLWRDAHLDVKNNGQLTSEATREGNTRVVPNPSVRLLLDFGKELAKCEAKFGLSPQDRAGLSIAPDKGRRNKGGSASPAGRKPKRHTKKGA